MVEDRRHSGPLFNVYGKHTSHQVLRLSQVNIGKKVDAKISASQKSAVYRLYRNIVYRTIYALGGVGSINSPPDLKYTSLLPVTAVLR